MGLAERRAIELFKNDEELAVADYADRYTDHFPQVHFQPLLDALRAIAIDDMGKDALREGMTKVVIRNTGRYSSPTRIALADGVLTFDHVSDTHAHHVEERTKHLQDVLESGL